MHGSVRNLNKHCTWQLFNKVMNLVAFIINTKLKQAFLQVPLK